MSPITAVPAGGITSARGPAGNRRYLARSQAAAMVVTSLTSLAVGAARCRRFKGALARE
jgi:hypothetical protein